MEREAHETWLKWRETDRKVKDLERESKSLQDQLARKAELKTNLEREIHEIHVRQERKAAVSPLVTFPSVIKLILETTPGNHGDASSPRARPNVASNAWS